MSTSIFAQFPPEIIRDIFDVAAKSNRQSALSLSLVSSWANRAVEPHLYHTVVLNSARTLTAFLAAISCKPATFPATRVHNLAIFALGPIQAIHTVIAMCSGVKSLACGFSLPSYTHLGGSAAVQSLDMTEQHLLGLSCREGVDTSAISPSVTRLRILLTYQTSPASIARLAELSLLTHLAVVYRFREHVLDMGHIHKILLPLLQSDKLHLLLVQVAGVGNQTHYEEVGKWNAWATMAQGDERIVAEKAPQSLVRQWEVASTGGLGVWDAAEKEVEKRCTFRACNLVS
ncbi:hypothetical protein SERLA73DRAFT_192185 [Serpula lacrymans var. lacrymans S7.3]|uniref:F-box domain-containing protein n=2 Tax=Serpula lacrymans var. lacrymans TaxID=341189 RepID=F8QJ84_SERL3|nr:uncharacterized protein SERLADRAFT_465262 [Serpula lacrymans var. lacrymans S7.9]EGN91638.1 hypothetical protein SERLA73DRAFT_192185 [Serpula lacrymans var. lacrymans S7.3]EGO25313.1 hypothetical protein SERLADRAFT_465262 [Serpula lacrymans var. lacrymans S7.9]